MYNLLDEDWLPVLWSNGIYGRVNIRKALTEAHNIRQIAASNPMDRLAVIRFLLALLYWCRGNPPDTVAVLGGQFPAEWFSKLAENRGCFELLGDGKRFYQDSKAHRKRAITDLLQEVPTGNNFWHFRHSSDGKDGLCLSCCTFGLLRLPLFSVSGLPNLRSGINGAPPIYVIPLGDSLFDTLLLNWLPFNSLGTPAWEQADIYAKHGEAIPLLTGLTMLSRRVWLYRPNGPPGACISCGSRHNELIRICEFQTAGEQENPYWSDPHVIYYFDRKLRKSFRSTDMRASGRFRTDRPVYNLLHRILEVKMFSTGVNPRTLLIVGFSSHQAYNIDVWEKILDIPSVENIETALSQIELWNLEENNLKGKLIPPNRQTLRRESPEIISTLTAIRPHVESKVSDRLGQLLSGGDEVWQEAASEYKPMMEAVAGSLSPGYTTEAVQRRQKISNSLPDMKQIAEPVKPVIKKKGGE